jgi:hypothetical protein
LSSCWVAVDGWVATRAGFPVELFQDEAYDTLDLEHLDVHPYGYRWIRLHRDHARR